mmetsp:Transcript_3415/g.3795  ORF Transcript_3415/g.3795 Transcript_3415/m.3795 type:complete len:147 (-) Transcript_3415:15-455(-)
MLLSLGVNLLNSSSSPTSCNQYKFFPPELKNVNATTRPVLHDVTCLKLTSPGMTSNSSFSIFPELLDFGVHVKSKKSSSSAFGLSEMTPLCGNGVQRLVSSSYSTLPALNFIVLDAIFDVLYLYFSMDALLVYNEQKQWFYRTVGS